MSRLQISKNKFIKGFTLPELLVSMGILAVIFAISSINLSTIVPATSQTTTYDKLISDVRAQQTLAMTNDSSYGIHFESASYTLFKGSNYSLSNSTDFVVSLDPTVTFTNVLFPGSQIIFASGSGDIVNYTSGSDSFSLSNSGSGKVSNIKINKYGATY